MTEIHKLHEKEIDIGGIVQEALKNKVLLSELLDNLTAKDDTLRSNSFQIFMYLSEKYPETVYPYWDFLSIFSPIKIPTTNILESISLLP